MSNCSDADQWRTTWNSLSTALSAKAEQWTRMVSNKTQQESKSGLPTHTGHTPVSPQTQTQPYPIHIQKKDLLMICMQSGKRSKQLDQKYLHEHGVDSDRALFSLLRKATSYRRNRLRSLFTLRTIRELKLVMVNHLAVRFLVLD